jgi:hypothetical protein
MELRYKRDWKKYPMLPKRTKLINTFNLGM